MAAVRSVFPGVTQGEAVRRLEHYGKNEFEKARRYSVLRLIWSQFTSPLIYILLIAMVVTLLLHDVVDAAIIGLAVLVNTFLGFWQEYRAERSLEKLAQVLSPKAVVLRDKQRMELSAVELVPGDVVLLEAGEKIPADGLLVRAQELKVNEAILTGESVPVYKKSLTKRKIESLVKAKERLIKVREMMVGLEDREGKGHESVYLGTTVMTGSAVMVVAHTGSGSQVGAIANHLSTTKSELTPLQKKLAAFSNKLAVAVLILAMVIFVVGILFGDSFLEMFTLAVAVAVSAIPEGLVVSLTAILAIGMQRMMKRKALVRKLVAAEVLGGVSVICSDKTGTLTYGKMSVKEADFVDQELGLTACLVTSDLKDPMEVALWEWAEGQMRKSDVERVMEDYKRIQRRPFSSEKKYSATLTQKELFVAGAAEVLMSRCRMSQREKLKWEEKVMAYAKSGYRVIGLVHRKRMGEESVSNKLLDKPWYWLGLVVYEDKIREGLKKHLKQVKKAGISLKVITGDYRETAMQVMKHLGVKVGEGEVMDGNELVQISEMELDHKIRDIKLFARTSPQQKLKIVDALQRMDEVVAMTGDGVNDAPALKKADIGIVVSTASDVSKETADMVLLDDNFGTIVAAVEEGRGMFKNLRKVLLYLLSDSFTEVLLVIGALVLGLPIPITAAQILWVNLANDGLPNLALTVDPHTTKLLNEPPKKKNEPIVDKEIKVLIVLISVVTAILVMVGYRWKLASGADLETARTFAFALLGVDSLVYVFSSRSMKTPIWRDVPWRNPWLIGAVLAGLMIQVAAVYLEPLQRLLHTKPLMFNDWLMIALMSFVVVVVVEVTKALFMRRKGQ